ncbi:MAG: tRNA uridine(34) 5-carboxymethylaminomethyl modification radical SAM/GNAT enzyme Elp3 [Candidatus Kerfeldbacteria bacterium CG08_land_8_20_14_0_20_42_7]|uniref:tRNA carboxymethyluridine synthase n=1 Tax=Candidatus Kerfeldbacteria bacterium CG08_land_8_20_14_0_20_42_7 TaxID=2014245 RepID=A0A2H0YSI4_9BACT|nr:MAG: tRNA uridine(34) 5-carboxymethylaminomethyl modification radical SAM/GNAT enzyme Elp3 [Candidatus Kerfeldbacteria bacterium CG08_land_8_20_14_0_20_42_7]
MEKVTDRQLICEIIALRPETADDLDSIKRSLAAKYEIPLVSHSTLLRAYKQLLEDDGKSSDQMLFELLRRRSIRTLSGVAPITVLMKPYPCPGRCVYCPTEARMPKSYLSSEPAAQRALKNEFDPIRQVKSRMKQLDTNGHTVDKIELIVLGGTWSFYPHNYQESFMKGCFDAANGFESKTLDEALSANEKAERRIIGVTLETRPDYVTKDELWRMRRLGCTHIQIGIQSLDQGVLDLVHRDETIEQMAHATQLIKQFGFKYTFHIMPGLPGATPKKDLRTFDLLFDHEQFQPDMLKIYPTVVVKSSLLYQWWKKGDYKPYDDATLRKLLIEIKKKIPPYVRINRLIRDIPGNDIIDGNLITNLRQKMQQQGARCQCIRCREARSKKVTEQDIEIVERAYASCGGTEIFISFENPDRSTIYAFVRLFLPKKNPSVLGTDTAHVRELHTYGKLIPVGAKNSAVQHIGFGKRLMKRAEETAKKAGFTKLAVISGIGVREYYKKLGYSLDQTYMVKRLTNSASRPQ